MMVASKVNSGPGLNLNPDDPNSSAIARLAVTLWEKAGERVESFGEEILHIPKHDIVEIFVGQADQVSNEIVEQLVDNSNIVLICVPLHQIGRAHEIWYGKNVWLQGWSMKPNGEVAFYESEVA